MVLRHLLSSAESKLYKINQVTSALGRSPIRSISYLQGQEPEPKIREYFYFIDHEGMVSI